MKNLSTIDFGLLLLRIWLAIGLFTNHGWEKLFQFNEMLEKFPDPLLLGKTTGLVFALICDGICTILIALGMFTRLSSFLIVINMSVVFFIFWQAKITEIHGELPFIYLGTYLFLSISGAGKYSLDAIYGLDPLKNFRILIKNQQKLLLWKNQK